MDKVQALKQIMQTNKMAFDYNYTMMMSAYEQNKLMFHTFLNQSTDDIPAEVKSAIEAFKVKHVIKQGVLRAYSDVVLFYRKIKLMSIVNSYFEFINLGT